MTPLLIPVLSALVILLEGAAQAAPVEAGSPVAKTAAPLRPADIEVQLTRALALLQAGDPARARKELTRLLEQVQPTRAYYLRALAALQLDALEAAARDLEQVAGTADAAQYPELLSLRIQCQLAMGRADVAARLLRDSPASALKVEERQVLETRIRGVQASAIPDSASRRKQALFASLSTGLDGNIAGLPSRGGMDCAPIALDGLQLESGCGPALQLRAGGWYVPRPGLRVAYRLFHQDYFIQEQRAFRRSDHQLQVGYSPVRKLGVVSSLDVVYASGQVQTPYRLTGQVRGFMRGPSLSWVDTRGEAWYAVDRYSDLAELLPLTAEAACTSEESAAVGGLYCTAGFSGRRYGVGTGGRVGGNAWSARAGLQLERREAQDPLWSGLELRNGLEARLRVAPATYLEGTLLAGFSWFQGWEMQRVEPGVALGFRPDDGLQLRLTYNYSRQSAVPVDDTDSSLEPTLYRRQVIGLELWGIYR